MANLPNFEHAIVVLVTVLAGAFTWTFLEYAIHRYLGHGVRFRKNPFAVEHIRHHSEGDYFAPTWKKIAAALLTSLLIGPPAVMFAGPALGIAFVAGLIGFYSIYEVVHRLQHVTGGFGPYGRMLRRHHFTHHFVNPAANFGVTSPVWDLVFGTFLKAERIRVPAKLCMRWLKDPATKQVREEWSGTFVLDSAR